MLESEAAAGNGGDTVFRRFSWRCWANADATIVGLTQPLVSPFPALVAASGYPARENSGGGECGWE